jgi:CRP-like cAMP-binding protein
MRAHENFLLGQMDAVVLEELLPHGSVVKLTSGEVIAETRVEIDRVYFPHAGIISCVVALTGGGVIETAMIGRDGAFGAALSLDGRRAFNDAVVQIGGEATVFDTRVFADFAERHVGFRRQLMTYEQFHLAEVQQTAACNAVHTVLARTCRWLLRMYDLVGDEIAITQESLSQMMGIRRTSVTDAARVLQNSGAITLSRGHVRIIDLSKISALACECHANVARNYRWLRHRER